MSLGEVEQSLMSLRDNMNNPPPYQDRIDNPMQYPYLTNEGTGKIETHKMAQMDNYAFPMVQLQDYAYEKLSSKRKTRSLKDFGEDTAGAWKAAKESGNYKKFDTVEEAKVYAKEGTWKTDDFKDYYEKISPGDKYPPQEVSPEYHFEPGLGNVAPVIEFGVGLAGKAVRSTKMYSDKVVDKWTKFRTPDKVYHGGPPNLSKVEAPYDRSMKDVLGPPRDPNRYSPLQAGTYSGAKAKEVTGYMKGDAQVKTIPGTRPSTIVKPGGKGSGLYEIDITDASKVYNRNKPSKYMREEIKKEVEKLKSTKSGRRWRSIDIEGLLKDLKGGYHITPSQREFLEKHGYQAWKHLEAGKRTRVVLFRPEKYKIKELDKLPGTEKVRSIDDIKGIEKAKKATEKRIEKLNAKAKKKRLKNPMAYKK